MKLIFPSKRINGVTAYAHTKSSDKTHEYLIVKAKTPDGGVNYRCSCAGYMFRGIACKHIQAFKSAWNAVVRKK